MRTFRVQWNRPNIHGLGPDCQLKPGVNEVPESVLRQFDKNPMVDLLIEEGAIEVLGEVEAGEAGEDKPKRGRKPKAKADETKPADGAQTKPADGEPTDAEIEAAIRAQTKAS